MEEENRNQTNNQTDDAQLMRDHPYDEQQLAENQPEMRPEEERTFTRRDLFMMVIGGYISMLPIFLAFALALLIVFLLFR